MAASTIDKRWTYYTLKWLTFTVNISTSNNTRYRCTGINRLWISDSEFKRLTDTYNTIRWTSNRLCRITNTFNITATTRTDRITTYRTIWMFLPLETAIGGTVDEIHAMDQMLHRQIIYVKKGDPVSDFKISPDWRRNIYVHIFALETI